MKRFLGCAAVAALIAGVGSSAMAGGFGLKEGSASALGAAFSGATAGANDITYTFWNPAALSTVQSVEVGVSASGIVPTAEGTILNGANAGQTVDGSDFGMVPAGYFGGRINDRVVVGISVSSPFGLATEYEKNAFGAGSLASAARSDLRSIQIAPMISYEVTPSLAIGGGPTILTGNLVFESANVPGLAAVPTNLELDVNDIAFGFQFGALWQVNPSLRIGASYHSGYSLSADGDAEIGGAAVVPGRFSADLPALVTAGLRLQLTDSFALQGEAQWQDWSAFDAAQISVNGNPSTQAFNYDDAWLFSVGGEYAATEALTVRTGFAYDQTPTSDNTRSIRIPDQDRMWFTLGASYALTDSTTLDLGYAYLTATEDAVAAADAVGTRVNFDDLHAHIFSLGATFDF